MRLGGWTRIGIVASVLWAVVGGVYVRSAELNRAEPRIRENYKVCGNSRSDPAQRVGGVHEQDALIYRRLH